MNDDVYEDLRRVMLDWWFRELYLPWLDNVLAKAVEEFNSGDWHERPVHQV